MAKARQSGTIQFWMNKKICHWQKKKLMNIVMQLNGDDNLLQLGEQTRSRLYFHYKTQSRDDPRQTIVFYTYTGQGVSKENSILTLEGFNHE